MRLFGSDKISGLMEKFGLEDDVPIEHNWISKAIENAQTKVEMHHYDIRKQVLEYDDVMNKQREVIYEERRKILTGEELKPHLMNMIGDQISKMVALYAPPHVHPDLWDRENLFTSFKDAFPTPFKIKLEDMTADRVEDLEELLKGWASQAYDKRKSC